MGSKLSLKLLIMTALCLILAFAFTACKEKDVFVTNSDFESYPDYWNSFNESASEDNNDKSDNTSTDSKTDTASDTDDTADNNSSEEVLDYEIFDSVNDADNDGIVDKDDPDDDNDGIPDDKDTVDDNNSIIDNNSSDTDDSGNNENNNKDKESPIVWF